MDDAVPLDVGLLNQPTPAAHPQRFAEGRSPLLRLLQTVKQPLELVAIQSVKALQRAAQL